jgi:hypothetical protein
MTAFKTTLLCLLALFSAAMPCTAQTRVKIPPPEFERQTEEDADGLLQFKEFKIKCEHCQGRGTATCMGCDGVDMPDCTECKGEKRARCRLCLGDKNLLDPLVEMGCPGCNSSGWFNCGQCNGFGGFKVGDAPVKCGSCKKKGRYKCVICDGKGRVPTVRFKKKLPQDAKLDDLKKSLEVVNAVLQEFLDFDPLEKASKSLDRLEDMIKKPSKKVPQLKSMVEMLETALKGLTKAGSGYQGYEARKTHQILLIKDRTTYLLQHNARVLDQCIVRAEHNEGK